jgi:hypothetical protein
MKWKPHLLPITLALSGSLPLDGQLAQVRENLARLTDEVQVTLETAYSKLERTRKCSRSLRNC